MMEPAYKRTDLKDFFNKHQQDSIMHNKIKREVLPPILTARNVKKTKVSLSRKQNIKASHSNKGFNQEISFD